MLYLFSSGDGLHISFFQHYLGKNGNSGVIGYQVYKYKLSSGFLARRNKPSSNKVPKNNRNIGIFSIITSGATPFQKGALAKPR
jgi:hypothetical protein